MGQATSLNVGFLTVLQESTGFVGGYLVTNFWGRPLEFRLSSAVQPNRIQQILYAGTLRSYICADLIGKTLVDRTSVAAQLLITDADAVLDLRLKLEVPVVWVVPADDPRAGEWAGSGQCVLPAGKTHGPVVCHGRFPEDVPLARERLEALAGVMDLAEPFLRIREAIVEARKMGVASRN
jgi:hypothetical protein